MCGDEVFRVGHQVRWRRIRGRALLTLDRHGVTRHSDWSFLPWDEIAGVWITTGAGGDRVVAFVPYGPDAALLVRARALDVQLEDLLTAVHRFTAVPINQRSSARA